MPTLVWSKQCRTKSNRIRRKADLYIQPPMEQLQNARDFGKIETGRVQTMDEIESVQKEWAPRVLFLQKEKDTIYFWIKYLKLNTGTILDFVPHSGHGRMFWLARRIYETFNTWCKQRIFVKWNCSRRLWQHIVYVSPRSSSLPRRPFGLKNSSVTFTEVVDVIFTRSQWQFPLVNFDDILILSQTTDKKIKNAPQVLTLFPGTSETSELEKGAPFALCLAYIGHVARHGGWKV